MSRPLFFCSSKPASTDGPPVVGHAQPSSSSAGAEGAGGMLATVVDDAEALAAVAGADAPGAEGGATAFGAWLRATSVPVRMGGETRRTVTTPTTFGSSRSLQRAMSRQFWLSASA